MTQTWLITGISSGFGREMAQQLLARGDRVAGLLRRPEAVSDLAAQHGERLWTARLDLAQTGDIAPAVEAAFAALGRIDVVVNNAGYGLFGAAEGLSAAEIREQIDTNLVAPILLTQAALPHLRAQGGGRILALSSYGGQATHPGASLYHASKWGLEGFFDSLAGEVAPFGIGVTLVEPGGARTGFRAVAGERVGADLEAYRQTPVGMIRTVLSDPARAPSGDPARMVAAMIASTAQEPAPKRLALGSDAYGFMHKALAERLAALEAQQALAASVDAG